jgi:hypothetical protein
LSPRMPSLAAVASVVVISAPPVGLAVGLGASPIRYALSRQADELPARANDQPEAAELGDVLAEDLPDFQA